MDLWSSAKKSWHLIKSIAKSSVAISVAFCISGIFSKNLPLMHMLTNSWSVNCPHCMLDWVIYYERITRGIVFKVNIIITPVLCQYCIMKMLSGICNWCGCRGLRVPGMKDTWHIFFHALGLNRHGSEQVWTIRRTCRGALRPRHEYSLMDILHIAKTAIYLLFY